MNLVHILYIKYDLVITVTFVILFWSLLCYLAFFFLFHVKKLTNATASTSKYSIFNELKNSLGVFWFLKIWNRLKQPFLLPPCMMMMPRPFSLSILWAILGLSNDISFVFASDLDKVPQIKIFCQNLLYDDPCLQLYGARTHCNCLQGITGLLQGNHVTGISYLQGYPWYVIINDYCSYFTKTL